MLSRVDQLLQQLQRGSSSAGPVGRKSASKVWGGTFHAVAARLLRIYGKSIGLTREGFSIQDRSDSEDLLDVVRSELELAKTDKRFPRREPAWRSTATA